MRGFQTLILNVIIFLNNKLEVLMRETRIWLLLKIFNNIDSEEDIKILKIKCILFEIIILIC